MSSPISEAIALPFGATARGGRHSATIPSGQFSGRIALSSLGAADPFAALPPGQFPQYPNGSCGATYAAKHQSMAFDSDHGDIIIGSGDITRDSQVDLFTYNAATAHMAPLLLRAQAGGGEATFNYSITGLSITNPGSGYIDGHYPNYSPGMPGLPLSGGSGTGAEGHIVVTAGAVTLCNIYSSGYGYTVGDVLTASTSNLGGVGSGFSATVTAISPAGTPSSIVGPVGRCLPGYAYDASRSVMWMEGGTPRPRFVYPDGFANNLVKGGLWALDRSVTPPIWHHQGPGAGESAVGIAHGLTYDMYSAGLWYDEVGDALYTIYDNIYKCSLNGISIDNITRDMWSFHSFPPGVAENHMGWSAFDTLRRRIVYWSANAGKTYAWNCATDTYVELGTWTPPFNNDWCTTYDANADRVICWTAGQYLGPYDGFGSPGYYGDYQGRRTHVMYQMDPSGVWSEFTPAGDQLIEPDIQYGQFSGTYDPLNKCLVLIASNQSNDARLGAWFDPGRLSIYHLSSTPAAPAPSGRPSWRTAMAANTWRTIPTANKLSQIDPANNPAYNANYPGSAEWQGSNGQSAIISAWCGACLDTATDTWHIPVGGGHNDYGGNEPYSIGLNAANPPWAMLRPPTGALPGNINTHATPSGDCVHSDGRIKAVHTANRLVYIPGVGPFATINGGSVSYAASGIEGRSIRFDPVTGEATRLATNPSAGIASGAEWGGSAYDASRHCVWWLPSWNGAPMTKYNITADTWANVGSGNYQNSSNSMCYIPEDDVLLIICGANTQGIKVFDCATGTMHFPTLTGAFVGGLNLLGASNYGCISPAWVSGLSAAAVWDNYSSTTVINLLNKPANPRTGVWTISQLPVSGANTVTPTSRTLQGTYSRFTYSPNQNGFFLLNATNQDVYFYALD